MKESTTASLATKMLNRANKDNLPADHILRLTAQKFEEAASGFIASHKLALQGLY